MRVIADIQKWAKKAIQTLRESKTKLPPHGDLFWKDDAKERLHKDRLAQSTIISDG